VSGRRLLDRVVVGLAGLLALVSALAWNLGGFSDRLGPFTLSVRRPTRPLEIAFTLLLLRETTSASASSRSRLRFALVYAGLLLALAAGSPIRLPGDGPEYAAMALNLAGGRPPALLKAERDAAERTLSLRSGELTDGRAGLLGADGRQDFHHFWVYPLLASPAVAFLQAAGVSPLVGFTAVNVALLVLAAAVLHARTGAAGALVLLGGPLLWWLDKAHPEVFFVSLSACALALLTERPGLAVALLGLAASQNPVFILALAVAALWIVLRGRTGAPGVGPGLALAVGLALLSPLYFLARLGRPTPLRDAVWPHLPNAAELGALLWDPNLGLGTAWPTLVVGAILGLVIALRDRKRAARGVDAACLLLAVAVLLVALTQPGNVNHGATRGMSRYALWLAPSAVPALAALARAGRRGRAAAAALGAGSLLLAFSDYHPRLPERIYTPTPLAEWIWTKAPSLDRPLPEVFAERAWGAPPLGHAPAGMPGCEKALLPGDGEPIGSWPLSCAPAEKPAWCRPPGVLCYANASPSGTTFAVAPRQTTFLDPLPRRWYWGGRPSADLARRFASLSWADFTPVAPESEPVLLRERQGIGRVHLRTAPGVYLVWFDGPRREGALVVPWAPEPSEAILVDPLTGEELSRTPLARGASTPVAIPLRAPLLLVVSVGGLGRAEPG
jgi:hypothetical protein